MVWANPWWEADAGKRFLWWLSAPMFLCVLAFSFKTGGGELNWPVTAYLSGLVLAAAWLEYFFTVADLRGRWFQGFFLGLTCLVGVTLIVSVHKSEWIRPVLTLWTGPPTSTNPYPLNLDPSCRLRGWAPLAGREIDRMREEYRAQGRELVLTGTCWNLPGEMGVYCEGHPQAYSIGLALDDRHSQYDCWPGPLNDPKEFEAGRSSLSAGSIIASIATFDQVEPLGLGPAPGRGHRHLDLGEITIAHGFRGFPKIEEANKQH